MVENHTCGNAGVLGVVAIRDRTISCRRFNGADPGSDISHLPTRQGGGGSQAPGHTVRAHAHSVEKPVERFAIWRDGRSLTPEHACQADMFEMAMAWGDWEIRAESEREKDLVGQLRRLGETSHALGGNGP